MKISYNWLKELIDIPHSPEQISDLLTGCGLEVEGIEKYESLKGGLGGIVIGEVKTCIKHPNADKLSLTTVDIGGESLLSIVCGAPNVAAGQKVLVATVGAMMYPSKGEPFEIKKSKIRGEYSEGMLCAEDELGMGTGHDGILVLPENYVVGKKAIEYFPVYEDYLIEIGLTANRGDAASHLGVARDLKALTNTPIKAFSSEIPKANGDSGFKLEIEDNDSCKRYSGISISNITVKDSPVWMKNKLKVIGINPINNIVDATNYVLHELGQPLHAFDADKVEGKKIVVKKMPAGTKFTTLDKTERILSGIECMICDASKPLAIAGVFGGLDSGIHAGTKNIFIESAYFDAGSVRKTARQHGLSTDASFRYERGTDPNITITALARITSLILEISGGEVSSSLIDIYPSPVQQNIIEFSIPKLFQLIGQEIPIDEVKRILTGLDIEILAEKNQILSLSVPPFRVDIKRQADVTEEILRIYGLNKIEIPTQLKSVLTRSKDEDSFMLRNKVADFLSNTGFVEMINNSLTKSAYYTEQMMNQAVRILNPLSSDLDIMRMHMVYNGLEVLQFNANRKSKNIKAYEYGNTYRLIEGKYIEQPHFALFITGKKQEESWHESQQELDFFNMKAVVSSVLKRSGILNFTLDYNKESDVMSQCTQIMHKGKVLGEFGMVKPSILKSFDLDQQVYFSDLNWNEIIKTAEQQKFELAPVSSFPSVRRDLALLLDQTVNYADLERLAYKTDAKLIREINVFDVYEGDKIEKGKKSYALSFILQDDNKTLTDEEIDSVMKKLIKGFETTFGASLRA